MSRKLKKIIKDCETEYEPLEHIRLTWEIKKINIMSFSVPYFVKKRRLNIFIFKLEKELDGLQQTLDFNPSKQSKELYVLNKKRAWTNCKKTEWSNF